MRVNHDLKEGIHNIHTMYNSLGSDHIQINSITVKPETQRHEKFGLPDIEEIGQTEEKKPICRH